MSKTKYICTLPMQTQRKIFDALLKANISIGDAYISMNGRLCDISHIINLKEVL